jgi:Myb-like DNA-binding domain
MSHKPYQIQSNLWMVPCLVNRNKNEYDPLYNPFQNEILSEKLKIRQTWLSYEDECLKELVSSNGAKNWIFLANSLNDKVHKGLPIRQGKQCRERWFNHLSPSLKKGKWTTSEELMILEKHKEFGNKWSEIAAALDGRTENQVKNRFKSLMRKAKTIDSYNKDASDVLIHYLREGNTSTSENFVVPSVISPIIPFFPYNAINSTGFPVKDEPNPYFYHS